MIVHIGGNSSTNLGTSCTLSYTEVSGNNLILSVGLYAKSTGLTWHLLSYPIVSDSLGNSYQCVGNSICSLKEYSSGVDSGWTVFVFFVQNCVGGSNSITVNIPGDPSTIVMAVDEYFGLANVRSLDAQSFGSGSGTSESSGDITTVVSNELLYSVAFDNTTSQTFTPTAGFTARQSSMGVGLTNLTTYDQIVSSIGTYNNTITAGTSSDGLHVALVSFSEYSIHSSFVQSAMGWGLGTGGGTGEGPSTAVYPKPNTSGNLLIALGISTGSSPTISDTNSNTWVEVATYLYVCASATSGNNTVTLSTSDRSTTTLLVAEYSKGTNIGSIYAAGPPNDNLTVGPLTVVANQLLLSSIFFEGLTSGLSVSSGWRQRCQVAQPGPLTDQVPSILALYEQTATTNSYSATYTTSSGPDFAVATIANYNIKNVGSGLHVFAAT